MALRIKDNVDLKELEKFGFTYRDDDGRWFCKLFFKQSKGGDTR